MVERYIARLRLTEEEAALYSPKTGIDVLWLEWEKPDVVVVEFVGSDLFPDPNQRMKAVDIRNEVHQVFRGRIIDDNLGTHHLSPKRALKIESVLEHPNVTSTASGATRELKKAAEAATEVRDIEMTKEQFDALKRPESGQEIKPREIRRKTRPIYEKQSDGRMVMRQDAGKTDEYYVVSFGILDIG